MTARLQTVIKRHNRRYHRIAKELGVNVYWIYNYIRHGKEPKNPELRQKMRLPKVRHTRQPKPEPPAYLFWWRRLPRDVREGIIRQAWIQLNSLPVTSTQPTDD